MKVNDLNPLPKGKVLFSFSSYKLLPKIAGCYVLSTFEGDILYLGLSDNLFQRFQQHLNNPEKISPTKNGKALWFYYLGYDNYNLPRLERTWINQYLTIHSELPILNKVNSPIR